jgi:hypothetical protein
MDLADATLDVNVGLLASHALSAPTPARPGCRVAVAGSMQHPEPRMVRQPAVDQLGVVDGDVVADYGYHWRGRAGGQQLLAERGEAAADGLAGHVVEDAAAGSVDGAEDAAAPVGARVSTCWQAPRVIQVAHPGQQVEVGLVFGQHDRAVG